MQGTLAETASGFELAIRPGHLVMQSQYFGDALAQKCAVIRPWRETADIDRPKVHGLFTGQYPFGQVLARASSRSNADGIEAGQHK